MSKPQGLYIPVVTPFADGKIDIPALRRHIRYLLAQGIDGLIPCGTTGESPMLTLQERLDVIQITVDEADGQVPVYAGVGGIETQAMIAEIKAVTGLNVSGLMVVCPYYVRPGQAGLIAHFQALAASTSLPLIIYNIPHRTAINLEPKSISTLAQTDNIIGIKEASPNLGQLEAVIAETPDNFAVFIGEDSLLFAGICLGADGAISAAGNVLAAEYVRMLQALSQRDIETARHIHYKVRPVLDALFSEPNPGPMKAALHIMGICEEEVRLPLLSASDACKSLVRTALLEVGKIPV